jgi:ectoine hydroxylase-related dioxygenase (phytanoyl-CoA dioxygenase family)
LSDTETTQENPDTVKVYGEEVTLPGISTWVSQIKDQGYTVIPDWIDKDRLQKLRGDLVRDVNPISERLGADGATIRAHNLLAKTRCIDDLVNDSRLLALVQGVLGKYIQISVVAMFDLLPGAEPQALHQDDGLWPLPRPHPPFVCIAILAIDDFTEENGGTMIVPGSHKWHDRKVVQPPEVETKQVLVKAGSLIVWEGALWHGGGTNNSTDQSRMAIALNFNLSYLRQQENQYIGVPIEEVKKMPKRLQRLVGYQNGISRSGAGMVDLRDPLDMLDKIEFGYDINAPGMPELPEK